MTKSIGNFNYLPYAASHHQVFKRNSQAACNGLLFATWHHMKEGTTAADCDASFIFINQRRDC